MTATVPLLLHPDAAGRHAVTSFFSTFGRSGRIALRRNACRPHHIDDAGREAGQQERETPPRRDPEHAVECPADGGTDQDPGHELAGKPKPARISRCIGARSTSVCFGRLARPLPAELITETPEPRGKS